jgi:CheY-like chemotaxis protein
MKILLIDDDSIFNILVSKKLQAHHSITSTENPYTGLGMLIANQYDCVVIDYEMPNLNGLEMIKLIRSNNLTKNTPTVLLTSYTETDIITKAIEAGFDLFQFKGDAVKNLNAVISEACGYVTAKRQLENEIALVLKGSADGY